jgi:hypothetical protein
MELSPSWEAARCAATQEIPNISKSPKVHYRLHESPPLVPILSQIDQVHAIPSNFSLGSILILSTHLRLGLPTDIFPSGFPTISYIYSYSPPFVLHVLPISSSLMLMKLRRKCRGWLYVSLYGLPSHSRSILSFIFLLENVRSTVYQGRNGNENIVEHRE